MRRNQKKAGIVLTYLAQGIQILSGLLYTPIMLRLLGQEEYGLYQLIGSVAAYLGLLSFGFDGAYVRFYARAVKSKKEKEVASLNSMFLLIFLFLAFVCLIVGAGLIVWMDSFFANQLSAEEVEQAKRLMAVMVWNMACSFPASLFSCYLTAKEQFLFQRLLNILKNLFNPFLTIPVLLAGYGSIGMAAITTLLTFASLAVNVWYCVTKLDFRFYFRGLQPGLLKEMWIFTFFIFVNEVVNQANWSVDKLLIGRMNGTAGVAVYGIASQINAMYMNVSLAVCSVYVPMVNRMVAEKRSFEDLSDVFIKVGRMQYFILAPILMGFILFGRSFLFLWAGNGYEQSYEIVLWLLVPVTIPLVQNLGIEIQRAFNLHKTRSIVYLLIAIGNVACSIPLIFLYGPVGAAMGTAIALTCGNVFFMNAYYQLRFHLDMLKFWKEIGACSRPMPLVFAFGYGLKRWIPVHSWTELLEVLFLYSILYLFSILFFGMNAWERRALIIPMKQRLGEGK